MRSDYRFELSVRTVLVTWRQAMRFIDEGRIRGDGDESRRVSVEALRLLDELAQRADLMDRRLMMLVIAARSEVLDAIRFAPESDEDMLGHAVLASSGATGGRHRRPNTTFRVRHTDS